MISITIGDMLDNKVIISTSMCHVYVIRDDNEILYVGKGSRPSAFRRLRQHLGLTYKGAKPSPTGGVIYHNLPSSRFWQVDMLTIEDCAEYVNSYPPESYGANKNASIAAEESTVRCLKPYLNIVYLKKEERRILPERYGPDPWIYKKNVK
jgi:hypothetical protein